MIETWKHKVIRESLEKGYSIPRIVSIFKLSTCAILNEIESDINSRIFKFDNLSPNTKYQVYTKNL